MKNIIQCPNCKTGVPKGDYEVHAVENHAEVNIDCSICDTKSQLDFVLVKTKINKEE